MAPLHLPKLPYTYDALEPYIDARTMQLHYSKHHQSYVDNFNAEMQEVEVRETTLEALLRNISEYPDPIRNHGGGHYNHTLFWQQLDPAAPHTPVGELASAIQVRFGSFESFKHTLSAEAIKHFGSGWAWLLLDDKQQLRLSTTSNQDNPLMDIVSVQGVPLLGLDVWEHAYYLYYQNRRRDYVQALWHLFDWRVVNERYVQALARL